MLLPFNIAALAVVLSDDFCADLECDRDVPPGYDVVEWHQDSSGPPIQSKTYNNDVSGKDGPNACLGDVEGPHSSFSSTERSVSPSLNG